MGNCGLFEVLCAPLWAVTSVCNDVTWSDGVLMRSLIDGSTFDTPAVGRSCQRYLLGRLKKSSPILPGLSEWYVVEQLRKMVAVYRRLRNYWDVDVRGL